MIYVFAIPRFLNKNWKNKFAESILADLEKENGILYQLLKIYFSCFQLSQDQKVKFFILKRIENILANMLVSSITFENETEFLKEIEMLIAMLLDEKENMALKVSALKVLCKFKRLFESIGIFNQMITFNIKKIKRFFVSK